MLLGSMNVMHANDLPSRHIVKPTAANRSTAADAHAKTVNDNFNIISILSP